MPSQLRPVGAEFFEDAPYRFTHAEPVPHPRSRVFAAIAEDPAGWGTWFPACSRTGRYVSPPPHGLGSIREITIGGLRYVETVIAWESPARWAFCVTRAGAPMARALAEDYRVEGDDHSSVVRWTFATEPLAVARPLVPVMKAALPIVFRRAMRNLGARLSESAATATNPGAAEGGDAGARPA